MVYLIYIYVLETPEMVITHLGNTLGNKLDEDFLQGD